MSEFTRMVDLRGIGDAALRLTANPEERIALARRFGLVTVERLEAEIALAPEGGKVEATGRLEADIVQPCAVSGEDLPVAIREPVHLRFVPATSGAAKPDEEIELAADELDEIEFSGTQFDLGEALAQGLALAINPFAVGPKAEEARRRAGLIGEGGAGPFAGLAALKGMLD